MDDDTPTLSVGFTIDPGESFNQLQSLDDIIGKTAADAVRQFQKIEAQMKLLPPGFASGKAAAMSFGEVTTASMKQAEKSGESMVRQMERQVEVFGKTASQVRNLRAEQRALAAEQNGMTELAGRLRATTAELNRLEAASGKAAPSIGGTRSAMQGLSYQAQDTFTQISMGTNVLSVLAIQGGQAAGQMAHMGGALGKVANFMLGPWGLAFTGGLLVLGALTKGLFDGADAAEAKANAAKELKDAIDKLSDSNRALTQTEYDTQRAALASALALRQQALDTRAATVEKLRLAQATLAANIAQAGRSDGMGDGGRAAAAGSAALAAGNIMQLRALQVELKESEQALTKTSVAFRDAQANFIGGAIAGRLDKATGLTREYQKQLSALNKEFRQTGDLAAYSRERNKLEATYAREKEALSETSKRTRGLTDEQRAAAKSAKELQKAHDELAKSLDGILSKFAPARQAAKDYAATLAEIDKLLAAGMVGAGDAIGLKLAASREASKKDAQIMQDQLRDALGYTMGGADDPVDQMLKKMNGAREAQKLMAVEADIALNGTAAVAKRISDQFDEAARAAVGAGDAIARAFGGIGGAVGDVIETLGTYAAKQDEIAKMAQQQGWDEKRTSRENARLQLDSMGAIAGAAKSMFKEHSAGYNAMAAAEKALAVIRAINTVKDVAAGAAKMFASLGPFAFPAVAAMTAVMAGFGIFSGGGSSFRVEKPNEGRGTTLGDSEAQSESIKNAINGLRDIDTLMLSYSRQMAASLKSIDNQIGGLAAVLVRSGGSINASAGVKTGTSGGILGSLFGSRTDVTGSGLYGGAQSVGSVLNSGFDASYYSDIQKTKKFLGIVTGRSTSTTYAAADPALENQFTLILRQFNDAIVAAAGPLGQATTDIQNRLNGFVINLGKIDLQGLTGEQIEERLSAVFGAAADSMASAAFPGMLQFQKIGEGAFETLVRVSSTIEAVSSSLDLLGKGAQGMGMAAKLGLADQFDSIGALTSAADDYFQLVYSQEEQAAARTAQLARVFGSLNLAMPETLASYRRLVDAQDLNTAAGQATYATLLQLAPAFAELQKAMNGAKSAADIASERQNLEKQLLELRGDTAALRALELSKLDASNRALQEQIWAISDAQDAVKAADELRQAWKDVGTTIMDEVKRIRGLNNAAGGSNFAAMQGQFNAASESARLGNMDIAKTLPGLSQALLASAAENATSRQELARIQAQTAASLETTNGALLRFSAANTDAALLAASATAQESTSKEGETSTADLHTAIGELKAEIIQLRGITASGLGATASAANRAATVLENVSSAGGGDSIATVQLAG